MGLEDLQAREEQQAQDRERLLGRPCQCPDEGCGCVVRVRFGPVCSLCRVGDHWRELDQD